MTPDALKMNKGLLSKIRKNITIVILLAFFAASIKSPAYAQLDAMPFMPKPGTMVHLSPEFTPAILKGIVIHPEDALKFDFIVYKGDELLGDAQKKEEYTKLIKYFLASLAIPDDDQWVNLSPYEKDRIIKDDFGKTEMGRDLLAQDYMLKQITASLIYPEDNLGKKFWDRVYTQAQKQYGTSNVPVNTFNKVWIVPDMAQVYEKGNAVFLINSHLKVMLEEDYLSLKKHAGIESVPMDNKTHSVASKIVKEIILPELEKEVNVGKNFAALRQVCSGMILAAWYKKALKESLLGRIYANKSKLKGVDQDPKINEKIYQQYLKAYKKGVFNFIKEDVDKYSNETIPRKYFSGGVTVLNSKDLHFLLPSEGEQPMKGILTDSHMAMVTTEMTERGIKPAMAKPSAAMKASVVPMSNMTEADQNNSYALARIFGEVPSIRYVNDGLPGVENEFNKLDKITNTGVLVTSANREFEDARRKAILRDPDNLPGNVVAFSVDSLSEKHGQLEDMYSFDILFRFPNKNGTYPNVARVSFFVTGGQLNNILQLMEKSPKVLVRAFSKSYSGFSKRLTAMIEGALNKEGISIVTPGNINITFISGESKTLDFNNGKRYLISPTHESGSVVAVQQNNVSIGTREDGRVTVQVEGEQPNNLYPDETFYLDLSAGSRSRGEPLIEGNPINWEGLPVLKVVVPARETGAAKTATPTISIEFLNGKSPTLRERTSEAITKAVTGYNPSLFHFFVFQPLDGLLGTKLFDRFNGARYDKYLEKRARKEARVRNKEASSAMTVTEAQDILITGLPAISLNGNLNSLLGTLLKHDFHDYGFPAIKIGIAKAIDDIRGQNGSAEIRAITPEFESYLSEIMSGATKFSTDQGGEGVAKSRQRLRPEDKKDFNDFKFLYEAFRFLVIYFIDMDRTTERLPKEVFQNAAHVLRTAFNPLNLQAQGDQTIQDFVDGLTEQHKKALRDFLETGRTDFDASYVDQISPTKLTAYQTFTSNSNLWKPSGRMTRSLWRNTFRNVYLKLLFSPGVKDGEPQLRDPQEVRLVAEAVKKHLSVTSAMTVGQKEFQIFIANMRHSPSAFLTGVSGEQMSAHYGLSPEFSGLYNQLIEQVNEARASHQINEVIRIAERVLFYDISKNEPRFNIAARKAVLQHMEYILNHHGAGFITAQNLDEIIQAINEIKVELHDYDVDIDTTDTEFMRSFRAQYVYYVDKAQENIEQENRDSRILEEEPVNSPRSVRKIIELLKNDVADPPKEMFLSWDVPEGNVSIKFRANPNDGNKLEGLIEFGVSRVDFVRNPHDPTQLGLIELGSPTITRISIKRGENVVFARDQHGQLGVIWGKEVFDISRDPHNGLTLIGEEKPLDSTIKYTQELFLHNQDGQLEVRNYSRILPRVQDEEAIRKDFVLDGAGQHEMTFRFNHAMKTKDNASITSDFEKGGIDLNVANLNLQIKRDGKGVALPISQQNLENIHIDGLIPVILEIKPVVQTPLLSQLQAAKEPELTQLAKL